MPFNPVDFYHLVSWLYSQPSPNEEARGFARKLIRQQYKGKKQAKYFELANKKIPLGAVWDSISRNPSNITVVGFRIVAL